MTRCVVVEFDRRRCRREGEGKGRARFVSIVDPAGEDYVGSGTYGGVFLIVGSYLTEMGLCCGEDIVGKL